VESGVHGALIALDEREVQIIKLNVVVLLCHAKPLTINLASPYSAPLWQDKCMSLKNLGNIIGTYGYILGTQPKRQNR
jgi:hypothetical protein